ncbi:MAG: hypothetical protein HY331_01870 [Chloroflexi bacterium]|nr:hypothetical protein [Chloroflexota bacterium]
MIQRTTGDLFQSVTGGTAMGMTHPKMRIGQPYETEAYGSVPPMEEFPTA